MARASRSLPRSASVVIVGGGVIGTSCAFHLAEAGRRRRRAARAKPARLGFVGPGSRRRPGAVLRRDQRRARAAEPARVCRLRPPSGVGDRPAPGRIPVRPHARGGPRRVRAQRRDPARARSADADRRAGDGPRAVPAAERRRRPRRGVLAVRRPRDAGRRRAGICVGRPRTRGDARDRDRGGGSGRRGRPGPRRRHPGRDDRDPDRGVRRRRLVDRARESGRRRASGDAVAPPDPVHRGATGAASKAADDDRLRDQFLFPSRGSRSPDGDAGAG